MKTVKKRAQSALMTLSALVAVNAASAHAEVLNIPAAAGMMSNELGYECASGSIGVRGAPPSDCEVGIPVAVPAGRTIQQISVIYTANNNIPNSSISAELWSIDFGTSTPSVQFPWTSQISGPNSIVYQMHGLMAQKKNTYPDAFVAQPYTLYQVQVTVTGGAFVTGLQVTYQ